MVRVEDTDTARSTRESEKSVLQDLSWLGLTWDEGPEVDGPSAPYRQSERMEQGIYQEIAKNLIESGDAYPCFCTKEELDKARALAEAAGENPQYPGTWRDADPEEVQKRLDAGEPYTVRFKTKRGSVVKINDLVRGDIEWDVQATVGDFILLRSGGMPVYNFCVAVDDATMGISKVIRAEEHLTNTVRQVLILEALGYPVPKYAHLSLVLGEDRSKLSKRHGATSVDQFKQEGYLPQAMINYLCLLGWNDGTDKEIYTVDELVDAFSLERVTKSPAVFDIKKLNWINGQHLRALPEAEVIELVGQHLQEAGLVSDSGSPFATSAALMVQEKLELVNDASPIIAKTLSYPLAETVASDAAQKFVCAPGFASLARAIVDAHKAGSMPDCSGSDFADAWKKWVNSLGKELGLKGKDLFMPLRIATTGTMSGPDIAAQMHVLALAEGATDAVVVSLDERMQQLEDAIAALPVAEPAAA